MSAGNAVGSGYNYRDTDDDDGVASDGNTNGYPVTYSSQQGQQLSGAPARFLSVNAAAQTGSNNFGYQTQESSSSENGALGSSGRSGEDPGFEPLTGDDSVDGGHSSSESQQVEDDNDDEAEEEEDNAHQKTQVQVDYSEENDDGNVQIDLGKADDDTEEESSDVAGTTRRVAKAGYRRRRRQKKIKPKVIIVKKIVPVSTTTYRYIG